MAEPIVNPQIPYVGDVPSGLQPGTMIRLQGVTYPNSDRFNVNLAVGPNAKPRDDTALHLSVRLNQGYVARNSYKDGGWGDEQGSGKLPIGNAQSFEIILLVDPSHYKIAINGQHFCEFPHRIPFQEVAHLLIDGDVSITLISFEGMAIPGGITSSQASQVNSATPQGAPQFGGPQYGPPQGGYGAPPPNYGGYGPPPPPGAEPQSEFGGFLDQAQDMLAGAIKSGAAEKLLSSVLHSGGGQQQQPQGYAHQNARYGIYPDLPTQDTAPASQNKGNFNEQDSALSSLIAGSGGTITTGPQPIPQSGGNVPPGARNMPGGPTVPAAPQSGGSQPGPLEGLLLGFLKGNEGQSGGNPPVGGAGGPQNTQSGGSDVLSGLLSSLLSGSKQNDQPAAPNAPPYGGNQPQTAQGGGSDLLSGILQSLVSGNKDQQAPGTQNQPLSGPQNAANTQGGQSQGSDALSSLLSSLLSSNQNQQNPATHGTPNQPQNQNQGGGGDVFSNILQGLISSNTQPTPGGQNVPPQNYNQPQNPQNQGQGNQNNAELITNLLRGLLSKASEQHDNTRPIQETHPSGGGPGNFGPVGGGGPMNMGPPASGGQMNMGPGSGGPMNMGPPASGGQMNFGPTSGSGPMNVGPAGGGGPGNLGPAQDPQQQYGQYPHPPQQEQRGPMESLLSGLLSGGGQQQQQQPHVPQVGGEGSVGGLGSMGGILGSLAGSFLHRPDPNQRN